MEPLCRPEATGIRNININTVTVEPVLRKKVEILSVLRKLRDQWEQEIPPRELDIGTEKPEPEGSSEDSHTWR